MTLKLVPPTPKPEETPAEKVRRRVREAAPRHQLVCRRCGASEFIETRVGVQVSPAGKPVGGAKALICLHCFVKRGERVEAP
ncbi:hypothetical protein [Roseateles sp. YR242]|uniref:hypothetical protein n=1 Tax=Roseateles sp. YR242 TaxID=1855305 RepID=UPI000B822B07|nr:hypothetical protein [Roseateles sp. YR242]